MRLLLHFLVFSNFKRMIHTETPKTPVIVKDAINYWNEIFIKEGISEPLHSIQLLLSHIMETRNILDVEVNVDKELDTKERKTLDKYCDQRLARMPVQYIIGEWYFGEFQLTMRPPVFIPRPETEELVDLLIESCEKRPTSIVEIGCGSGAISIALAKKFQRIPITAIDASEAACNLTRENLKRYHFCKHVEVVNTKLLSNATFYNGLELSDIDIIVSNPPYIKTNDIKGLQPEIRLYEDIGALDGGERGMDVIYPVMLLAAKVLQAQGTLMMEVDPQQVNRIRSWLLRNRRFKLKFGESFKDFARKERFVRIIKFD